ncbi:hypothetical protein VHAB30_32200 [Variovorax boronicumulans]|nr:hypothetical protein VHAB30_32200 [Variovorax boronicumulans]
MVGVVQVAEADHALLLRPRRGGEAGAQTGHGKHTKKFHEGSSGGKEERGKEKMPDGGDRIFVGKNFHNGNPFPEFCYAGGP